MEHRNIEWWGAPKDFKQRVYERKVGWLELFYDLVYVAAIGQLTHHLAEHPSWYNLGYAFLLFSFVFWSWVNGSQYYDLHGNEGIRTRLITFWQMLAVAAVAITIPGAFEGHHRHFAIAFIVLQCLITYLWWSVGLYDHSHRVFNIYYTVNYLLALALLVASVFTQHFTATLLWIAALALNLTPSLTGARTIVRKSREMGQEFSASATIVERFGLFTIIVLAESILATVGSISNIPDKTITVWIAFILAILISFLLWSIYFDMLGDQEPRQGYFYMQGLLFMHFPLLAALSVVGASLKVLLVEIDAGPSATLMWMFCGALAVILWMVVGLRGIMKEEEEVLAYSIPVSRILIITSVVLLLIPLAQPYLSTLQLLSLIAVLLFIPVFTGVKSWVRYRFGGS